MDWPVMEFGRAAAALLIERLAGYPDALYERLRHPVVWMGSLIDALDRTLNLPGVSKLEGRLRGVAALAILVAASFVPAVLLAHLLSAWSWGWLAEALLATTLIAQTSMRKHVMAVYDALGRSLAEARTAVGRIVGRDPAQLDESGIAKAALESLAENSSDGIVAPVIWYALLGLPGIVVYKAISTADSMIGHRSEKYLQFGWAAARLDDLVNLPASRLTGLLFAACQPGTARQVIAVMRRDAPHHQSPNAGWPEAAMAAALGLRFGGPRSYDGEVLHLPYMGEGRSEMDRSDIKRGLALFSRAMWLLFAALALLWLIL
jgi:adenosylcobinamide-phosphate synthase